MLIGLDRKFNQAAAVSLGRGGQPSTRGWLNPPDEPARTVGRLLTVAEKMHPLLQTVAGWNSRRTETKWSYRRIFVTAGIRRQRFELAI
jgi:hypothetical protein